ncbi:acyltransferase [Faecalicatena contorta]|uniref:Surface polysaccharide O-acyltransferase, integral membrane enzyme n=1 Tax=Faecalicatena contorta TaxID=39482 RepID=A0A315ZTL8_9FIRM|nr:acyltransferase family protein [Faecalicatena contorta]PWJ48228.1 surface polysaccharide O-acyltransferase-like enzyme [Faecalicatena contorta]SUQ15504.1 Surface polysaccharide O-acyltransferase, integral membrane enzyme [Faecalicatena contorta]
MKNRIFYFDLLNIIACYGVIWLHCSGDAFTFRLDKYWLMSLTIQVIAHWAVPVFFMLTGANLMNYREKYSTEIYFKRRLLRIFIPFLAWSTIYLIWKYKLGWVEFSNGKELLSLYLNNGIEGIFWFFYPLLAIYLSMPILAVFSDDKYKKTLYYLTALGILAYSFMPLLSGLFGVSYTGELNPPVIGGYMIYVLLGWIFKHENFSKGICCLIYGAGVVGAICMFAGTIVLSLKSGVLNDVFWGYMTFPTLFMACAVFLLVKKCRWKIFENKKVQSVAQKLSAASFGIYLIHIMIINLLLMNGYVNGDSRWWMMFGPAGVYIISVTIVILCKKIPGIRYLFP